MLIIHVSPACAYVESGSPIPSGSVGNPTVMFRLDEFWADYAVTAQFDGCGNRVDIANLHSDKAYTVPWECISEAGVLTVRVFGLRENDIATTRSATVQVVASGIDGSTLPQEPTPTAYQQYVNQVHGDANRAADSAAAAESACDIAQNSAAISQQTVAAIAEIPARFQEAEALLAAAEEANQAACAASALATEAAKKKPAALVESNHGREVRFWFGTQDEYAAQMEAGAISDTTYCVITDDTTAQEVAAIIAAAEDIFNGQYGTPETLSDALLISTEDPFAALNTHRWRITPESIHRPTVDSVAVENFYGIREPILRFDDDIIAVARITEIAPVFGRQWITYYSSSDESWNYQGWIVLSSPEG